MKTCPSCEGQRFARGKSWFRVDNRNIAELSNMNLDNLAAWLDGIELRLSKSKMPLQRYFKRNQRAAAIFIGWGLTYLTLNRPTKSLSGGESQRIRLATQIGSQLQGKPIF